EPAFLAQAPFTPEGCGFCCSACRLPTWPCTTYSEARESEELSRLERLPARGGCVVVNRRLCRSPLRAYSQFPLSVYNQLLRCCLDLVLRLLAWHGLMDGDAEPEGAASLQLRIDSNFSTMLLDNALADDQPKPRTFTSPPIRSLDLFKGLEQLCLHLGRNT